LVDKRRIKRDVDVPTFFKQSAYLQIEQISRMIANRPGVGVAGKDVCRFLQNIPKTRVGKMRYIRQYAMFVVKADHFPAEVRQSAVYLLGRPIGTGVCFVPRQTDG